MVGGNFRVGTLTRRVQRGALSSQGIRTASKERRYSRPLNPLISKQGCEAKSWPDIIVRSQDGTRTSDAPCRSSVDDSVSLTTTALVTCMSGCCCLASCIAIARACKEGVNHGNKFIDFLRFLVISSQCFYSIT